MLSIPAPVLTQSLNCVLDFWRQNPERKAPGRREHLAAPGGCHRAGDTGLGEKWVAGNPRWNTELPIFAKTPLVFHQPPRSISPNRATQTRSLKSSSISLDESMSVAACILWIPGLLNLRLRADLWSDLDRGYAVDF